MTKFLYDYKSLAVYTKFAGWKNIKIKTQHEKINYYTKSLKVVIYKRRKELKY